MLVVNNFFKYPYKYGTFFFKNQSFLLKRFINRLNLVNSKKLMLVLKSVLAKNGSFDFAKGMKWAGQKQMWHLWGG